MNQSSPPLQFTNKLAGGLFRFFSLLSHFKALVSLNSSFGSVTGTRYVVVADGSIELRAAGGGNHLLLDHWAAL